MTNRTIRLRNLVAGLAAAALLGVASPGLAGHGKGNGNGHGHGQDKAAQQQLVVLLEAVGTAVPDGEREAAGAFVDAAVAAAMRDASRALLPAFGDARPVVRYYAVVGLGASALASVDNAEELEKALPALAATLSDDSDPRVREAAAAVIAAVQPAPPSWIAWPLTLALEDPEPRVVAAALAALARIDGAGEAEQEAIARDLYDEDAMRRSRAVRALAAVGGSRDSAVDLLVWALGDPDPRVRWHAATALGGIGTDAAAANAELFSTANDRNEDPAVREAARMALNAVLK